MDERKADSRDENTMDLAQLSGRIESLQDRIKKLVEMAGGIQSYLTEAAEPWTEPVPDLGAEDFSVQELDVEANTHSFLDDWDRDLAAAPKPIGPQSPTQPTGYGRPRSGGEIPVDQASDANEGSQRELAAQEIDIEIAAKEPELHIAQPSHVWVEEANPIQDTWESTNYPTNRQESFAAGHEMNVEKAHPLTGGNAPDHVADRSTDVKVEKAAPTGAQGVLDDVEANRSQEVELVQADPEKAMAQDATSKEVEAKEESAPEVVIEEETVEEAMVQTESAPEAVVEEETVEEVMVQTESAPEVVIEEEMVEEVMVQTESAPEVVVEEEAVEQAVVEEESAAELAVDENTTAEGEKPETAVAETEGSEGESSAASTTISGQHSATAEDVKPAKAASAKSDKGAKQSGTLQWKLPPPMSRRHR